MDAEQVGMHGGSMKIFSDYDVVSKQSFEVEVQGAGNQTHEKLKIDLSLGYSAEEWLVWCCIAPYRFH